MSPLQLRYVFVHGERHKGNDVFYTHYINLVLLLHNVVVL